MPNLTQPLKLKKEIDGQEYTLHPETSIDMVIGADGASLGDKLTSMETSVSTNTTSISTIESSITELETQVTNSVNNSKTYVDNKIADLVSSAPETLDTLNEIANALNNDANFATTVLNNIAGKADINHNHPVVNETTNGLMTPDMLGELSTAVDERSKIYYSTTKPENLREIDLWIQPITTSEG